MQRFTNPENASTPNNSSPANTKILSPLYNSQLYSLPYCNEINTAIPAVHDLLALELPAETHRR